MIDSWHTRSTNNLASCQISITNFKFWDGNKFLQINSKYSIVRARFIFFLELLCSVREKSHIGEFRDFFTLKIASEALGLKNEKSHNGASTLVWEKSHHGADLRRREKSQRCFNFGLGEKS